MFRAPPQPLRQRQRECPQLWTFWPSPTAPPVSGVHHGGHFGRHHGAAFAGFQFRKPLRFQDARHDSVLLQVSFIVFAGIFVSGRHYSAAFRLAQLDLQVHRERWGWARRYTDYVIAGAEAVKSLPEKVRTIVLSETAARELAKALTAVTIRRPCSRKVTCKLRSVKSEHYSAQ